jgi:hypothetical protein
LDIGRESWRAVSTATRRAKMGQIRKKLVVFELDEEGWLLLERPRPTTTSEMDVG